MEAPAPLSGMGLALGAAASVLLMSLGRRARRYSASMAFFTGSAITRRVLCVLHSCGRSSQSNFPASSKYGAYQVWCQRDTSLREGRKGVDDSPWRSLRQRHHFEKMSNLLFFCRIAPPPQIPARILFCDALFAHSSFSERSWYLHSVSLD